MVVLGVGVGVGAGVGGVLGLWLWYVISCVLSACCMNGLKQRATSYITINKHNINDYNSK